MCDVRQRGGVVLESGKEEQFCLVSRPACEAPMRESELAEEEDVVVMCAFLLIRER